MVESKRIKHALIFGIYFPWILASILADYPVMSYWIAWTGSFFIFYLTWFSKVRFILPDIPVHKQIMRPIFLQQAIFAGFMCCTSVFYFLDKLGFLYFEKVSEVNIAQESAELAVIAFCQRLSLLAHAALVTGFLILQNKHLYDRPRYIHKDEGTHGSWVIRVGLVTLALSLIMERLPGLFQFSLGLYNVAIFSGTFILVDGLVRRKTFSIGIGGAFFAANLIHSTLSGYKEYILVNFIILACLLYPHFKAAVTAAAIPIFICLFYILPTYTGVIRDQAWFGEMSAEDARSVALDVVLNADPEVVKETNWAFLTNRLTEIDMFKDFVSTTPSKIPFYGFDIIENAVIVIIPRALWQDKPITESLAMERVYNAGIVELESSVSAKTRPIVDGYLSAGVIGVFIYMIILGLISQGLSNLCENLFGGYHVGCVIFYNGFFQILWRGETTEFLGNSLFWNAIMLLIVFRILVKTNYLKKVNK